MRLTASIVTYLTDEEELGRCIDSILEEGAAVCVVDNSPSDSLSAFICRRYGRRDVEYISRRDNPGFGTSHNIAIRKAIASGSRYHLVINSDVSFKRGTLRQIMEYMESDPEIGVLQPRVVYPGGGEQYSSRLLPTPCDLFGRRFLPRWLTGRRNRRYLLADRPAGVELDVPYLQGSFLFFRVGALTDTGLFDERFFMYPEDIDITRRMHERYKTVYWPRLTIVHAHRAASYHHLGMLRIHMVNMIRYFNKWGWWRDPERRKFNRRLLDRIKELKEK